MAKPSLFKRVVSKSPGTLLFRGRQEAALGVMRATAGWQRLARGIDRWADEARATAWLEKASFAVCAEDGAGALRQAADRSLLDRAALVAGGDAVMAREFTVFETPVPKSGPWPWHEDWRFEHEWSPDYFRNYRHDAPRSRPYDVKFPWELSRLWFLPSLVQADILDGGGARTAEAFRILADWADRNPLAHSVNWYPMEAAMRGIELCLLADMARQVGIGNDDAILLLRLLAGHGEFVMRTLELTDNAGNHYTAELVALLLIGRTLRQTYRPARRWQRFAQRRLGREIMRQFLPDGVNFEKSTAYHRLVLDLFLLASIALERSGRPLDRTQNERLRAAARYDAAFLRPDHACPLVGDSDDALVFGFEHRPVRDHRPSLGLAALLYDDAGLKAVSGAMPASGPWLVGHDAIPRWAELPDRPSDFEGASHFSHGGVFIAKQGGNYLFMDVGEVGQNGLGGHGHNDLLSFELCLYGRPFVVDPGSYLYSGDFAAHDRFRSTRAHNGLVVDDEEIASFTGRFRIADRARPADVVTKTTPQGIATITAAHTGYRSLSDPVMHTRTVHFDPAIGALQCRDRIKAEGAHRTTRLLHFAPGLEPVLNGRELHVVHEDRETTVRWDGQDARARLVDDEVSPCYGKTETAKTLIIDDDVQGETLLELDIFTAHAGSIETSGASA